MCACVCVCLRRQNTAYKIANRRKILSGLERAPLLLLLLLLSLTYSILVALTQTLYYIEIDLTNILLGVYYIFVARAKLLAFSTANSVGRSRSWRRKQSWITEAEADVDAWAGKDYVCYGNNFNKLQLDVHTHTYVHTWLEGESLQRVLVSKCGAARFQSTCECSTSASKRAAFNTHRHLLHATHSHKHSDTHGQFYRLHYINQ